MTISESLPWSKTASHNGRREGVALGITLATATWLWVALVDAIAGHPFHTFHALGGVLVFTLFHYTLNIILGLVLVSVVHDAEHTPSAMFGLIFCGILFECGMGMFTNILAAATLGPTAWMALFGGSLLSATIAITLLVRRHPLGQYLTRAELEN
jgi:hypothetical protein